MLKCIDCGHLDKERPMYQHREWVGGIASRWVDWGPPEHWCVKNPDRAEPVPNSGYCPDHTGNKGV